MSVRRSFNVLRGGNLGQTADVTANDITAELAERGYAVQAHHVVPEPHVPAITRSIAIKVAVDEAIVQTDIPRTATHLFRCPSSGGCAVSAALWDAIIPWCVSAANGYLAGSYSLPAWASNMMHAGSLSGLGAPRMGGFSDWLQQNTWFVKSVGDTITNYGEFLTAQQVTAAIKANTDQQLTKADALQLVQALQAGGYVRPGQTETINQGASMAASPSWMMPLMVAGGAVLVILLMRK